MTFQEYKNLIPAHFPGTSTVWVYQCNRDFTEAESKEVTQMLDTFNGQWNAHGSPVPGFVHLFFNRFIILMADETAVKVSGCSIDSTYWMLKKIEQTFQVQVFDRLYPALIREDKIQTYSITHLQEAVEKGEVSGDTLFFNNLVATKQEWLESWIIPLADGWPWKKLNHAVH